MTNRIEILTQEVANQIAAGEVVERPASVIKELVENSLDAGAHRIDVTVSRGGKTLMRVVDDGHGMSPAEAELSLKRHATSKLRRTEDLQTLSTMGFRGEALPSIASVCRFTLLTRARDEETGFRLRVDGGRPRPGEPAGCRVGTQVEVAELFYNTPARLKFLKSTATEATHIQDVISQLALVNPGVHLTLNQDGRRAMDHVPCGDRLERSRHVLGRRGARLLQGELSAGEGLQVHVCLGPPEDATRSVRAVRLIVNSRAVRDRRLVNAVVAGYGDLLERGRFPVAVVYLEMDPRALDVNVHPQKQEVRFSDPARVFGVIRRCVKEATASGTWSPPPPAARRYELRSPGGYDEHRSRVKEATERFWSARRRWAEPTGAQPAPGEGPELPRAIGGLRFLGLIFGEYLVCEEGEALVLIDRRAAREKVVLDRLTRQAARGDPGERLLVPAAIDLDSRRGSAAEHHGALLGRLGLELDHLGGSTWTVRTVPGGLRGADPGEMVLDVLDAILRGRDAEADDGGSAGEEAGARLRGVALARMARHHALHAGSKPELDEGEAQELLAGLDRLDSGSGGQVRGAAIRLGREELARMFRRR